jgi:hypothetical protein
MALKNAVLMLQDWHSRYFECRTKKELAHAKRALEYWSGAVRYWSRSFQKEFGFTAGGSDAFYKNSDGREFDCQDASQKGDL